MRGSMRFGLLALLLLAVGMFSTQAADEKKAEKTDPDVIYVATPEPVVDKMLEVGKVTDKDTVYDLGCGDGRIVIRAARLGAKAVGIDIDPERIKECKDALGKEKDEVKKRVQRSSKRTSSRSICRTPRWSRCICCRN